METILLLEDEESVSRGISFVLEREGYQVLRCGCIREAEQMLREKHPQLALCDLTLPDGSGLDFIRNLRKNSSMHVICLTALDQELDQVMGYEAGADDYITKPFSLSVLLLKVKACMNRMERGGEESRRPATGTEKENGAGADGKARQVFLSGDLRIFPEEVRVNRGGRELSLTKNEWKLLNLFVRHPRQILSKNQLLQQVFDLDGDFVDDNTVAVNIRRLREKIEPDPSNPRYIRNVRGMGYLWNLECRAEWEKESL